MPRRIRRTNRKNSKRLNSKRRSKVANRRNTLKRRNTMKRRSKVANRRRSMKRRNTVRTNSKRFNSRRRSKVVNRKRTMKRRNTNHRVVKNNSKKMWEALGGVSFDDKAFVQDPASGKAMDEALGGIKGTPKHMAAVRAAAAEEAGALLGRQSTGIEGDPTAEEEMKKMKVYSGRTKKTVGALIAAMDGLKLNEGLDQIYKNNLGVIYSSVKPKYNIGVYQILGDKDTQEDTFTIVPNEDGSCLMAIFDGHGTTDEDTAFRQHNNMAAREETWESSGLSSGQSISINSALQLKELFEANLLDESDASERGSRPTQRGVVLLPPKALARQLTTKLVESAAWESAPRGEVRQAATTIQSAVRGHNARKEMKGGTYSIDPNDLKIFYNNLFNDLQGDIRKPGQNQTYDEEKTDRNWREKLQSSNGATAVIAYLDNNNNLTVANVGDAKAVLGSGTPDHSVATPLS